MNKVRVMFQAGGSSGLAVMFCLILLHASQVYGVQVPVNQPGLTITAPTAVQGLITRTHRLEETVSYEQLSPDSLYGSRKDVVIDLFTFNKPGFVWFAELGMFRRQEGDGVQGGIGGYWDWSPRVYTYSSISAGTVVDYLPKLRLDTDFNVKLGHVKNIVATLGVSYITYHIPYEDLLLSAAGTYYGAGWLCGYRIFQNKSEPGSVVTYSHQLSAAVGAEGKQWTYLTISHGITGYTATTVFPSQEVRNNVDSFDLRHRHWLTARMGLMGGAQCITMKDGYDDLRASVGSFFEF